MVGIVSSGEDLSMETDDEIMMASMCCKCSD